MSTSSEYCTLVEHYPLISNIGFLLFLSLRSEHIENDMAKKKSSKSSSHEEDKKSSQSTLPVPAAEGKANSTNPSDEDEDEDSLGLLQVDLGDILKVKQVLDEATASALVGDNGLEEDVELENIKLVIMSLACCFAMVAQFAPLPFPESCYVLGGCCVVYFLLSGVLQVIALYIERDSILIIKPPPSSFQVKGKKIRVRSSFAKFEEWYVVEMEYDGMPKSPFVRQKWSVGDFFDAEGFFDDLYLTEEVRKLCKRFEVGDYDEADEKLVAKEKGKKE